MALSGLVVWEVRPATGSDTAGGGFDPSVTSPGTDYSQQASAQIAFTDLVIDPTTNTKATSVLNAFTSAHVGNIVQITSGTGFTTGFFTILSVTTGVATFDRALGSTSSTGGHGNLGGALASLSAALLKASSSVCVAGNTIWMTGTLTITATINITIPASDSGLRIILNGYGSSRGDGTHAAITTSTGSINMLNIDNVDGFEFNYIDLSNTAGSPLDTITGPSTDISLNIVFNHCSVTGGRIGMIGYLDLTMRDCEIKNMSNDGLRCNYNTTLLGCRIHGSTGANGVSFSSNNSIPATLIMYKCMVYANAQQGIVDNGTVARRQFIILNCVSYGNGDSGIQLQSQTSGAGVASGIIINTISYGNGQYGIQFQTLLTTGNALNEIIMLNNALGGNTSGNKSSSTPPAIGEVSLTGNPFTNVSTGDFTLNNTAGAGAACKSAGWEPS